MEMIAGAGVVRTNYCYSGGIDLGKVAARKSSHTGGYDWFSNSDKLSVHGAHSRYISAAAHAATGNGAFSGNRAEDINDALSTVLPHTLLEKDSPAFKAILAAIASVALEAEKQRRHEVFPGKTEVPVDALRQGRLVESRLVYRQTFVIRSYEIGADRTASIETMMNHFQETALNHVWMSGLAGDGFGATRAMSCRNLIWVVTRMQVHVEQYPAWGDVVEMDTWVAASGKNGMRRDWLVRDYKTGQILARATSTWVMMNRKTRKLSKMPEEVRAEICPYFLERSAIKDESLLTQKIIRLNGNAEFVRSGLTPRRSDLDMNQHVNNVKYIGWMMESVPPAILDGYELASMSLEYRRECGQSDVVQSMTSLEPSTTSSESESAEGGAESNGAARSHSLSSSHITAEGARMQKHSIASQVGFLQLVHLLRMENDGAEIVRGRTQWRPKNIPLPL
jgi:fatty acyl-ACP thioesterase B